MSAELMEDGKAYVDDLKENQQEIADQWANLITQALQQLNNMFLSFVDELTVPATMEHVIGCMDNEQANVDAALQRTIETIAQNALSEVPRVTDVLEMLLQQAGEIQRHTKIMTDSLDTCYSEEFECFATFAANALEILQEIFDCIDEDHDVFVTISQSIISDVEAWDIRGTFRDEAQIIFNEAVECIYSN